jgi:cysteine desulfurase
VFTSGATESNNLALRGVFRARRPARLVTTAMEHKSVAAVTACLAQEGVAATVVPPDGQGRVPVDRVLGALDADTVAVSMIAADGEVGAVQPLPEVARECRRKGILVHSDATQAVGRLPVTAASLGSDLLSLSAHKFGGPKGVGALYVRAGIDLHPMTVGGGQERGLRSGTLNVPGIVGLGAAAGLLLAEREAESRRLRSLAERLWQAVLVAVPDAKLNGPREDRLPGNLNVTIPRVGSESLMQALPGFAFSAGSACQSGQEGPSPILAALGMSPDLAACTVRFGLGRTTTEDEVDRLARELARAVRRLRPVLPGASAGTSGTPTRYN